MTGLLANVPPQAWFVFGVILSVLGLSFFWKAFQAMVKGRLKYWDGFLPLTLASLFLLHGPTGMRSLIKETEGLWVHMIFGPIYMFTAILCLAAGMDMCFLPGTSTVNLVINGGKIGSEAVIFDKNLIGTPSTLFTGYRFPIVNRAYPVLAKLFGTKADTKDKLTPDNQESLGQAMNH